MASRGEQEFELLWDREFPAIVLVPEFRFVEFRGWRFDFAAPPLGLAVEIEGGTAFRSRHTSGPGFEADCEKYNAAAILGWLLIRFTTNQVLNEQAWVVETLNCAIRSRRK
jgi:very-short-patch-repair endonuclease